MKVSRCSSALYTRCARSPSTCVHMHALRNAIPAGDASVRHLEFHNIFATACCSQHQCDTITFTDSLTVTHVCGTLTLTLVCVCDLNTHGGTLSFTTHVRTVTFTNSLMLESGMEAHQCDTLTFTDSLTVTHVCATLTFTTSLMLESGTEAHQRSLRRRSAEATSLPTVGTGACPHPPSTSPFYSMRMGGGGGGVVYEKFASGLCARPRNPSCRMRFSHLGVNRSRQARASSTSTSYKRTLACAVRSLKHARPYI
jgi:hypothetical protein